MKYKIILYLDLGFIPKISHYVYANIPKSEEEEKKSKTEVLLVPSILDEVGFSSGFNQRQRCYAKDLGLEFAKCWLQPRESVFGFCWAGI